ncbi:MAG: hypothetical protein UZ01_01111 [Candidatus Brocadia sinica]|nr:MAG: hypothetical protein UZ01_01111 [Candidatus Brocadia sinica]
MYISIKSRLIFLLIVFTLLPFVLLRIIAYPRVQTDLQEVLIRNLDGIGHKQTELVTNWMYERIKKCQRNRRESLYNQMRTDCQRRRRLS